MLTKFWLLALAGGLFRAGGAFLLWRHYRRLLAVPGVLAAALVVLAGLPDLIKPVPFPLPLSLTLGLLLPDLLFRRG
jgi:hypothetical protein